MKRTLLILHDTNFITVNTTRINYLKVILFCVWLKIEDKIKNDGTESLYSKKEGRQKSR
jgi:hypothetical protein